MKKKLKVILVVLAVVISGGVSAYYLINISQPWYTLTNVDNCTAEIGIDSELMRYNETLVFGNDKSELKFFDLSADEPFIPTDSINLSVSAKQRFEIENNMLYTIDGSSFYIVNITDRVNHGIVGEFSTTYLFHDFHLEGDLVYITSLANLFILNISDPENMVSMFQGSLLFDVHGISFHNNLLYVAESTLGIKIFNVTNPTAPQIIDQINDYKYYGVGTMESVDVYVTENFMYIIDKNMGLVIYNQTNPGEFDYMSSIWGVGETNGFSVNDNIVYIGGNLGFKLIDVSDPLDPKVIGYVNDYRNVLSLVVYESNPYILHGQGLSLYLLEPGIGPNPVRKELAIEAITGFLQVVAYMALGVILVAIVRRSRL